MRSKCHPDPPKSPCARRPRPVNCFPSTSFYHSLSYFPKTPHARILSRDRKSWADRQPNGASVINILGNSKIRRDSVKRMIQIQKTSYSFAATKYFSVAAREHTLAPPGRHRPRHSRMRLTSRQFTPAIEGAFYDPIDTLYQLQSSFHTSSTEPEPTARARRAGKEFY